MSQQNRLWAGPQVIPITIEQWEGLSQETKERVIEANDALQKSWASKQPRLNVTGLLEKAAALHQSLKVTPGSEEGINLLVKVITDELEGRKSA